MPTETQVPTDHPLWQAWLEFKNTEAYVNSRRWALFPENVDGSLWALFRAGWERGVERGIKFRSDLEHGE